jgi:hypothetical protein
MYDISPYRRFALPALLTGSAICLSVLLSAVSLCPSAAAQRVRLQLVQAHRQQPAASQPAQRRNGPGPAANRAPKGEHLAEWMNQHSNLSAAQQQQALEREPGFHELPSQTQQRERERLAQLNAMSPERRQQIISRNEHMESLTPDQRGQVRGAMQQLGALPQDQRRMVARSFRELRDLPADQRPAAMGRLPLNDAQRATLGNLLRVEPLLPPPEKQQ